MRENKENVPNVVYFGGDEKRVPLNTSRKHCRLNRLPALEKQ
jgi:hypothetical protein